MLGLPTVNHHVAEQIKVARALPNLRMHDDRRVETDHLIRRRSARRLHQLVVAGDHVAPPGLLDVALQLNAERAVVPEAVETAVDFARLKQKPTPTAQGN